MCTAALCHAGCARIAIPHAVARRCSRRLAALEPQHRRRARVAYTRRTMQPAIAHAEPAGPRDAAIISLIALAHGTSHFFQLMLPALFPWLMRDFSLSYTQVGLLTTTFFVISGVGQALAGFAVDRVGARPVLFVGIGLLALSGVVLGLSNSYQMLIATAAVAGLGNSIFHP